MTNDEIKIVIAEACGWLKCTVRENGDLIGIPPDHTKYVHIGGSNDWAFVPNYTGDLNAMHEAEKQLDDLIVDKRSLYFDWLCLNAEGFPDRFESNWAVCRATARQRCEAFIKTVCPEKWKD